ncbi:MAG: DUF2088 domain-containing protein [Gemmatimonadota bacterium]|nr:MAG: DUF2088 domain-containing protein [Gemmatimonadota bacterium]
MAGADEVSTVIGKGLEQGSITEDEIRAFTEQALSQCNLRDKRVLVIIPDLTRNAPIPVFFRLLFELLGDQVKNLDYLIALGTHQPMDEEQICERVGVSQRELHQKYEKVKFFNHAHDKPEALVTIGTIPEHEIDDISNHLLKEEVEVTLNKMILDYDFLIIMSPVVPHEVAGFSGGNKYLFPGIAGECIIHCFHWLSALITNSVINGTKQNPVRKLLDRAASLLEVPRICFCMVVHEKKLSGLFIGSVEEAWSHAADLSQILHIQYFEKPFHTVLGVAPLYYDDIWVAGKVMYKLESVVADGGELIIYAPHITKISHTHGEILHRIGYHVGDYYLKQMDKFGDIPRCVLAHSTHVRGIGTFENGIEKPRIKVTLATGIAPETCERINLSCRDAETIDFSEWKGREKEGILFVENAGEVLYRLKTDTS